ncbi:VPLPA-CTERM sorting domain-containing protein [Frigidibacter sp. ROC022]|uniref:VPLPA-CTERM sorting domain-containing protein n=1 Tax=Frigidibacter sp. ROC022 TaxID=2971796 RepID=UPI00215AEE94|nr:VPLPA-CTERM sorting domain-containing protein [Frigidibacter sp. ROC022]MCR8726315.1 VPLPA-CTERM sorting domain-containing protein [Frigidibacter sp. ROC022]
MNFLKTFAAVALLGAGMAGGAVASTVHDVVIEVNSASNTDVVSDVFTLSNPIGSNSGPNCPSDAGESVEAPCGLVNNGQMGTLTAAPPVVEFDLVSMWIERVCNGQCTVPTFVVKGYYANGTTIATYFSAGFADGKIDFDDIGSGGYWNGLTKVEFSQIDGSGNVRYDNIAVRYTTAAVPLPAAGLLLLGAFGALGAVRRRRKAA